MPDPAVDGIGSLDSFCFLLRQQRKISAAAVSKIAMATATKTPATLPELEKKPCGPSVLASVMTVWVEAGGAVGVTVRVMTCPVTVMTDKTGVGVQVEELEEDLDDVVGIKVVDGVGGVGGVDGVDGVDGVVGVVGVYTVVGLSRVIDLRIGCCDVKVSGGVELVDGV